MTSLRQGFNPDAMTSWGLTRRELVAMQLQVPESGTEWIDAMIRKARRMELAGKMAQGTLANKHNCSMCLRDDKFIAKASQIQADALLARLEVDNADHP